MYFALTKWEKDGQLRDTTRDEALASVTRGSTPLSRTVELRVVPFVAAYPVSAAVADCDTARCSQKYQPWPRRGSGSADDSRVPV